MCVIERGALPAVVCLYLVAIGRHFSPSNPHRKLIELRLASESGALCGAIALDVPEIVPQYPEPQYPPMRNMGRLDYALEGWQGGRSPFFFIRPLQMVFDTRTRLFYGFPKFHIAMVCRDEPNVAGCAWLIGFQDEIRYRINSRSPFVMNVLLTTTHVFSFVGYHTRGPVWHMDTALIQAFTVPDDDQPLDENRKGVLRLSHEGISFQGVPYAVIRNSIVEPITGSIGVRFLCRWMECNIVHPKCVDVTLHKPSPVDVTPMTVCWHAIVTRDYGPIYRRPRFGPNYNHILFLDSSGDGYTRGLFTAFAYYPEDGNPDPYCLNRSAVAKFTIDATQECCVATPGEFVPLPAEWKHFNHIRPGDNGWIRFDAIRGRLFYIRYEKNKNQVLVVIDVE